MVVGDDGSGGKDVGGIGGGGGDDVNGGRDVNGGMDDGVGDDVGGGGGGVYTHNIYIYNDNLHGSRRTTPRPRGRGVCCSDRKKRGREDDERRAAGRGW